MPSVLFFGNNHFSGEVDPRKSGILVPNSMLVLEQGKTKDLKLDERDKYGNRLVSVVEDLLKYDFLFHEVSSINVEWTFATLSKP